MGTILYPTIREFASRHDQLAWACSAAAAKHLQRMEIDSRDIFESVEQAVEYLRLGGIGLQHATCCEVVALLCDCSRSLSSGSVRFGGGS